MGDKKDNGQIGALWKNDDKDFVTGRIEIAKLEAALERYRGKEYLPIGLFKNTYKKGDTHPDYHILVLRDKEEKGDNKEGLRS